MAGFDFRFVIFVLVVGAILAAHPGTGCARGSESLREGIALYNAQNYEKAVAALTRARAEAPDSAEAAFHLGMAYRQANDIVNACAQFEQAARLDPLFDEVLLQLIESATLLNQFDTALKWISVLEGRKVHRARVAFLKGTALAKQEKYREAIAAFERSKKIDPGYAPSADLQIGICYMSQRKYALAEDHFQSVVAKDPISDIAAYALRYKEVAEQWRQIERPLRLTVSSMAWYDSNYREVPEPSAEASSEMKLYLESQKKESMVLQNLVLLGYTPMLPAPFTFNAAYMAASTVHQRYGTDNDTLSNGFTIAPGLGFDRFAVSLKVGYTHYLRRESGYKRYCESIAVGPLFRFMPNKSHVFDAGVNFLKENFAYDISDPLNEDESFSGPGISLNWTWLFRENALFNLKLDYAREDAEGQDYDNEGCRASMGLTWTLRDKLRLQLGGEFHRKAYRNEDRTDLIYAGSAGLTWSLLKQMDVIAQCLYALADSNIYAYDYDRKIYSLGMELKF